MDWETTPYAKWYKSHRRFSFTAKYCIEQYEDGKPIPERVFKQFLQSLYCHSKSEEKMFQRLQAPESLFKDHASIIVNKIYTNEEKYSFCKSLLIHMKEEEEFLRTSEQQNEMKRLDKFFRTS